MLNIILFFFLRASRYLFHFFSYFWYFLTVESLFTMVPPKPSFMDAWLDLFPKQFLELCDFHLHSGIPAFLRYAVMLGTTILGVFISLIILIRKDTISCLLLMCNPCRHITVIIGRRCFRGRKYFYFIRSSFPVILCLHGVQKVRPIFVRHGAIVLTFFFQFTLHGCCKSVPSCDVYLIIRELFVTDEPICLIVLPALHQM